MKLYRLYPALALLALSSSACMSSSPSGAAALDATTAPSGSVDRAPAGDTSPAPAPEPTSAPTSAPRAYTTDVMLFAGSGTWAAEVSSLESILTSHGATYKKVTSAQLNAMSVDEIAQFGVLLFPGGAGGTEAGSLTAQTHANLREAVQQRGVNYVGFCAGAFIAQAPAPAPGQDVSYGLGVLDGPELEYYYLENQGQDIAMTLYTFADGSTADILYYGGPVTPNEGVIARYPNGDPAISQIRSGKGLVIISGGHPTATQAILSSLGVSSSDGTHTDIAWKLIEAAMHQQPLQTF